MGQGACDTWLVGAVHAEEGYMPTVAIFSAVGWSQVASHCLELRTLLGLFKQRIGV